jgi:hypothetical protein
MLYATPPSLPGEPLIANDNYHGSDTGAMLHAHLPYSIIESRAIEEGEFPLWNRYLHLGNTLIGQGQSMIGDPFHWITIIGRGSAASWDTKFVVARLLFCSGVGCCAWLLTRHLGASLCSTFSAAFLGYFSFRYNHAAQFTLCYSPWLLFAWLFYAAADSRRQALLRGSALLVANWLVFNSGTVKEMSALVIGINFTGLLPLLLPRPRFAFLTIGALWLAGFTALAAPLWLTFLDSLANAFTAYSDARADQIPIWQTIGLADDLFFRQLSPEQLNVLPSANLVVALGVCAGLAAWREWKSCVTAGAMLAVALLCWALSFGVIPAQWVTWIPFVRNIQHIHNVGICVLLVLMLPWSALGWRALIRGLPIWKALGIFSVPVLTYLSIVFARGSGLPLAPWLLPLGLALALGCIGTVLVRRTHGTVLSGWLVLALAIILCLWRHAEYPRNALLPSDHVVNPGKRVELVAITPAVEFVRAKKGEAHRSQGLSGNLLASYPAYVGLETIFGVDALQNRRVRELLTAVFSDKTMASNFPMIKPQSVAGLLPFLRFFNVRYLLASPETRIVPGCSAVFSSDLNVFEVPDYWPRAFATNRAMPCSDTTELVERLGQSSAPFAALEPEDAPISAPLEKTGSPYWLAASSITLQANVTSFTIESPSPCMAVLCEAGRPSEFQALVDGRPTKVVQVNRVYKGVFLTDGGRHHISFRYSPPLWRVSLYLSGFGALLVAILLAFGFRARTSPPFSSDSYQLDAAGVDESVYRRRT